MLHYVIFDYIMLYYNTLHDMSVTLHYIMLHYLILCYTVCVSALRHTHNRHTLSKGLKGLYLVKNILIMRFLDCSHFCLYRFYLQLKNVG